MAEKATIARPYARAAFEHAREAGNLAGWSKLLAVGAEVASDPRVEPLFGNPAVGSERLVELVSGVAGAGGLEVDAGGRNFLRVLADNHRLAVLPEIAAQYEVLRAEAESTVDVEVVTASALTPDQRDRLGQALAQRFRRRVRLREAVDESLIGGALIRAGDLVIDGTLKGRLERLEQQMSQQ